ncbi:flavin reductase (DIM6/NTAB) family NADH-FMN oxidoreductase RutF [Primorskyibacter sedentarius]|uniref:Flavin reductase (DIM6/NTAB) family NADH-FMN oxidoreductase RutF n=1 Tax=Primorskyibacter sedentarius TaxID=745311 RepID=A0A4R3JGK8_9RHOB|nr:flavin reductase family protein [Primorskyibacter sedentarius]TCS64625.1 flavin reductase (DIM6/NTAB) family NADH-FMN oxidoreductase RutF [Primorskyibacter sedentarius]
MFYDPRSEPHGLAHNPWTALVVPRPIGWVSTLSDSGDANLAPYSFFNAVSGNPPFVMFSSAGRKDTQRNAETTGEFVVNMATAELMGAMNASSAVLGPEVDEFSLAGLEKAQCHNVSAPRVSASPVAIECVLNQVVTMTTRNGTRAASQVIIGEVVGIHIADEVIVDGVLDIRKMRPLSRLGYMDYSVIDEVFAMDRPS